MNDFLRKSVTDPWTSTIVFGLLFLLGIGGALFYINKNTSRPEGNKTETEEEAPDTRDQKTQVVGDEFTGPVIRYSDTGFVPTSISLTKEDRARTSCAIKITNESSGELLIRLGPPTEKDNWGVMYPPVPPGELTLIDPRYTGIPKQKFYNRHMPGHTFEAILDPACFQ